ncbi:MAG: DUF460 domain-containing protein [Candidatus Helarchaeota archaeon]
MVPAIIMGLDILPMSSATSKTHPKYAVIIFENDKIIFKNEELSFRKLKKVIPKYKPDILAMDNIWELAPTQDALQNILREFPPIKLVQVTGSPSHGMQPIHRLAKHCGIQLTSHPTPIETAEICARLARIGIGFEVALFEKETRIQLTRTRSLGPGGWSQNRYRRHSHAVILQATRDIQTQLDAQGIEYDLSVRKADYGLDRSSFTVYSSMNEVLSTVTPYHGSTIQIKITPIKKKELEFIPLTGKDKDSHPLKSLIVGIDPGTTTGIAIVDLNGNLVAMKSAKEFSRRDIIKFIYKYGTAVLISTDVAPQPKLIEKIANTFNALIFHPKKSMKVSEKQDLVTTYLKQSNRKVADAHLRDSLACALKAYYSYLHIFNKIQKRIEEMNVDVSSEKVKALVIRGYSIYDAISLLTFTPDEKEEESISEEPILPESERINALNEKIYTLIDKNIQLKRLLEDYQEKNQSLKKELTEYKEKIIELESKLEHTRSFSFYKLRGERLIRAQEKEINHLRKQIGELEAEIATLQKVILKYEDQTVIAEELKRLQLTNKIILLKVVENFSKDCIESVKIYPNDVIYMLDGSGGGSSTANQLICKEIGAIITNTLSHAAYYQFRDAGIPVIPSEEVLDHLKTRGGFYYLERPFFEQKLKFYQKKQKAMNLRDAEIWLENLVDSYRKRKEEA